MIICLDTGILGILSSPIDKEEGINCRNTTNVSHLSRFIDAQEWQNITF